MSASSVIRRVATWAGVPMTMKAPFVQPTRPGCPYHNKDGDGCRSTGLWIEGTGRRSQVGADGCCVFAASDGRRADVRPGGMKLW